MQNFNYKIKLFAIIIAAICAQNVYCFDGARQHFFSHGPSASAFGAGETLFSQRNDPSIIQYNPALQCFFNENAAGVTRFNLFDGSSYNSASASVNLFGNGFFGVSASNLSSGDIEARRDIYDTPNIVSINTWNFLISYGGFLDSIKASYGINIKYFYQDLYFKTAGAFTADLGAAKLFNAPDFIGSGSKIKLALAVQNILSAKLKADIYAENIPQIFRVSSAFVIPTNYRFDSKDELGFYGDAALEDGLFNFHIGASYLFAGKYAIRAGYYTGHFTAGFGADFYSFTLDYAADFSEIDLIHRFALSYRWRTGANDELYVEAKAALERESAAMKKAEEKFDLAKKYYSSGEMLRASDILSEIIVSYKGFEVPAEFYGKIKKKMDEEAKYDGAVDFAKLSYAKAYVSYYGGNFSGALSEWNKYTAFTGGTPEVNEYAGKISSALKLEEMRKKDAELSGAAQEMLEAGIKNFNAAKWISCIKDMEKLQKWTALNSFSRSVEFYTKAKEYIDRSVAELTKTIKPVKNNAAAAENNTSAKEVVEVDSAGADTKYNEGLVAYAQGKYLEAQRAWEIALRLDPEHVKAKVALEKIKTKN